MHVLRYAAALPTSSSGSPARTDRAPPVAPLDQRSRLGTTTREYVAAVVPEACPIPTLRVGPCLHLAHNERFIGSPCGSREFVLFSVAGCYRTFHLRPFVVSTLRDCPSLVSRADERPKAPRCLAPPPVAGVQRRHERVDTALVAVQLTQAGVTGAIPRRELW